MTTTLKTVVFMGSSRSLVPPWGGEARLGSRVLQYVTKTLAARNAPVRLVGVQPEPEPEPEP